MLETVDYLSSVWSQENISMAAVSSFGWWNGRISKMFHWKENIALFVCVCCVLACL